MTGVMGTGVMRVMKSKSPGVKTESKSHASQESQESQET